jgi:hypothetical protein
VNWHKREVFTHSPPRQPGLQRAILNFIPGPPGGWTSPRGDWIHPWGTSLPLGPLSFGWGISQWLWLICYICHICMCVVFTCVAGTHMTKSSKTFTSKTESYVCVINGRIFVLIKALKVASCHCLKKCFTATFKSNIKAPFRSDGKMMTLTLRLMTYFFRKGGEKIFWWTWTNFTRHGISSSTKFVDKIRRQDSSTQFIDTIRQQYLSTLFVSSIVQQDSSTLFINKIRWQDSLTRFVDKICRQDSSTRFVDKIRRQDSSTRFVDTIHRHNLSGRQKVIT